MDFADIFQEVGHGSRNQQCDLDYDQDPDFFFQRILYYCEGCTGFMQQILWKMPKMLGQIVDDPP